MNPNPHSDNQAASFFQRRSTRHWLTLWVIIYALILIVGIFSQKGTIITIIKLTGVLLCSVYSIAVFPCDKLLQFAMMTTFVADCLLAINNISVIGLMVFFIAQIIHLYRLSTIKNRPYIFVLSVIGLFIIACGIHFNLIPPIYIVVVFYAIALISNIIASRRWQKRQPRSLYANAALIGFLLFGFCDLCIVVSYLSLIEILPAFLYGPANFFAWFFYYPSQILVSNSSKYATIEEKEGKC